MKEYFELNKEEEMRVEEKFGLEEEFEPDEEELEEEFKPKDRNTRFNRLVNKNKEKRHKKSIAKKSGAYKCKGVHCTSPTKSKKKWKTSSHRLERRKPFDEMETFKPNRREIQNTDIPQSQYVSLLALRQ